MKEALFIIFQYIIPHRAAGAVMEALAECRIRWVKNIFIRFIIWKYNVDLSESDRQELEDFENFNEFFTRKLKEGTRSFRHSDNACVSPVDGILADYGDIESSTLIIAKKVHYNIYDLLGATDEMSGQFMEGSYMSIYLSPRHYHRIHMPELGTLKHMRYIPGKFYSVNDSAVNAIDNLYTKNERLVCYFETERGWLAVVFIGALFVGSIHTTWQGRINPDRMNVKLRNWTFPNIKTTNVNFKPGDEIGHFQMGSSIILLWSEKKDFNESLQLKGEIKVGEELI